MNFLDDGLERYRLGRFTDADMVRCTGLSLRALRELIKTRALATITESQGRGYVRLCDSTVLKRAAVIGALNRAGLSLAVAGHVAYALPFHTLLYEICDPWMILFECSTKRDSHPGLPPRVRKPRAVWFNPNTAAEPDPGGDWLLRIYDGRFVGAIYDAKHPPTIFGDLRNGGATFIAWWPFRRRVQRMGRVIDGFLRDRPPKFLDFIGQWESPAKWPKQLESLGYRFEPHNENRDPLCAAADASVRSPLFTTTINVTLAIRSALRRYLNLEPAIAALEDE